MDVAGEALGLVGTILTVCKVIYNLVHSAKTNKVRCQQLVQKVRNLEELVLQIQQRYPDNISPYELMALRKLHKTLVEAKELIQKYAQTKGVGGVMRSSSIKDKFNQIDKGLSDNFQILSGALLVEQLDVMHDVYDTVKEVRRPAARPSILSAEPGPEAATSGPVQSGAAEPGSQPSGPSQPSPYGYGYGYGYFPPGPTFIPWPGFGAMTPVSFSTTITSKATGGSPIVIQSTVPSSGFSGFSTTFFR